MNDKIIKTPRDIPSIEILLNDREVITNGKDLARKLVAEVIRGRVAKIRERLDQKEIAYGSMIQLIVADLNRVNLKRIGKVINGAGILVHTNLGRAPLSISLFDKIKEQVTGYGNLEFDVASGRRGKRGELAERYLSLLSEAEAGAVVNNNAASLFIIINTLANRRKVVISRGELVQIGGGFRIPDIIKRAGAKLVEIGTTNITTLDDYRSACEDKAALILKVHQSNFAQRGFTDEVGIKDLIKLGREFDIPVVNDLGSGVFIDTSDFISEHEPTVQESVRDGADLTCFSGDKLLGGMQAGLMVGRADLINKIKKNPVFRTVRIDKTIFSALEELLGYYLDDTWREKIKLWKLASRKESDLYRWGHELAGKIGNDSITVQASQGRMGGGSLPGIPLPSIALAFKPELKARKLAEAFRAVRPPVVGRIEDDIFMIDLLAVDEEDFPLLLEKINEVLKQIK